jgi:hypothetical protein
MSFPNNPHLTKDKDLNSECINNWQNRIDRELVNSKVECNEDGSFKLKRLIIRPHRPQARVEQNVLQTSIGDVGRNGA